ncbi:MAG: SDR family oxidoreductase [Comamonadaceae bacterium]|nr:MAG: SDR family oxidoreductase [Comamonadaceae bacterium]
MTAMQDARAAPGPSTGRVALVTGAARGIGAAAVLALARRGFIPVLAVRDPAAAAPVLSAVQALGTGAHAVRCDVSDDASVRAAVAECLRLAGRIDVLVNNAGRIDPIGLLADTDAADWAAAVSVNLAGPYRMARACLAALERSPAPCIVNVSTGAAHTPREGWSAYCAAKAGLVMLTRSLALEYPQVSTYGLQPGVVDTEMQVRIRASGINEISRIPRAQLAGPERPANVIAWICDKRPPDLVGQDLTVNDAALMRRVEEQA